MSAGELLAGRTIEERQARCRRCKQPLQDAEPFGGAGEWWHKRGTDCVNDGKELRDPEIVIHLPKKALRARNRGARMASKLRPKR